MHPITVQRTENGAFVVTHCEQCGTEQRIPYHLIAKTLVVRKYKHEGLVALIREQKEWQTGDLHAEASKRGIFTGLTSRRFLQVIRELEQTGQVTAEVKSFGHYGRTTIIRAIKE